jgi:hypothetical protein
MFSVKELLMSNRLAMSLGDISQYHIYLSDAYIMLVLVFYSGILTSQTAPILWLNMLLNTE